MTKVFAFDIDGTFLNSNHEVQETHIDAIKKAVDKGHHVVLCSGRPYFDMIPVLEQVPSGLFRYLICNNGAYVMDLETNERIMENDVPFEIINDFEKVGRDDKFGFAVHTLPAVRRGIFWDKNEDTPEWFLTNNENMEEKSKKFVEWDEAREAAKNERIAQLSLIGTKEDIENARLKMVKHSNVVNVHIAGEIYLDINPLGVSKLTGIETLSKRINVPVKNFVVFGDSGNDIQMLEGAGTGVAMGNATQQAKNAADVVIGSNNTSALADKVIELI